MCRVAGAACRVELLDAAAAYLSAYQAPRWSSSLAAAGHIELTPACGRVGVLAFWRFGGRRSRRSSTHIDRHTHTGTQTHPFTQITDMALGRVWHEAAAPALVRA
jgi:hypothetical protein